MLLGNLDAGDFGPPLEHIGPGGDFDMNEEDWKCLEDLEVDSSMSSPRLDFTAGELSPRNMALDMDVRDLDDFNIPDLDALLNDPLTADGMAAGVSDEFWNQPFFQDPSSSFSGGSLCTHVQNTLLRQGLPDSLRAGKGMSDGGCKHPCCTSESARWVQPHGPSGGGLTADSSVLTPQAQQRVQQLVPPMAPPGPGLMFQATPASSGSEDVTGPRAHRAPSLASSGVTSSGGASVPRSKAGAGVAAGSAPKHVRGIAHKRLRSPEPRPASPQEVGGRDGDAHSPAYSSDEGPASSGDSTTAKPASPDAQACAPPAPTPSGQVLPGGGDGASRAPSPSGPVTPEPVQASFTIGPPALAHIPPPAIARNIAAQAAAALPVPGAKGLVASPASSGDKENGKDADEEVKKAQRMQKNRESALLSRQRRRILLEDLERKNKELETHNSHLNGWVVQLQAENTSLRALLAQTCAKHGEPMPQMVPMPVPMVAGPPSMPGMPVMAPQGLPMQYAYPHMMPYPVGIPMPGVAPASVKVPIQKLAQPARPAPAPRAGPPAKRSRASPAASGVPAKAVKGTVALAAICCLFVFAPMGFINSGGQAGLGNLSTGLQLPALPSQSFEAQNLGSNFSLALPAAAYGGDLGGGHGGGRVLMSEDPSPPPGNLTVGTAVSLVHAVWDTVTTREWGPSTQPAYEDWEGVPLQRNDPQVEALALKRLKELGHVAVISGWDNAPPRQAAGSPAPWRSFPGMASSVFSADGLLSPATCEEVFTIDAESLADPIAARRKLQAYVATMQTFKGRHVGALPLPPIGGLPQDSQEVANRSTGRNETIGCPKDDGGMLVSVLLPTKQPVVGGNALLTSLDRIFVVVLKPSNKYSTYACGLQKPVLV